jgi:AraC family transcriptional regulator
VPGTVSRQYESLGVLLRFMTSESPATMNSATASEVTQLVARLARLLERARINSDSDYEVTKRLVAEASLMLERHVARSSDLQGPESDLKCEQGGLARWQINRVQVFIEEHLTERVRVADLSAVARSSPSYFSCAFKRTFGVSPHAYVMKRRVSMAADLMLSSDAPLSEIAVSCGFADQAHFSRQFRRAMGRTPSAWRRESAHSPFTRRLSPERVYRITQSSDPGGRV